MATDPNLPQLIDVRPLVPYEANSRTHTAAQIEQIKASYRMFGFVGIIAYEPPTGLKIGHARRQAAMEMWEVGETVMGPGKRAPLPTWHLPAVDVTGLTEPELRALVIADNKLAENAGWDQDALRSEMAALAALNFDMPVMGFDAKAVAAILNPPPKIVYGGMAQEFLVPPFSVLNAREGWWQERKRGWIGLGIRSEIGRGEAARTFGQDLLDGEGTNAKLTHLRQTTGEKENPAGGKHRASSLGGTAFQALSSHPRYYEQKTAAEARVGRPLTPEEFERDHWVLPDSEIASGTSIFDPVVCELVYRWFMPTDGVVLDPFAGGSVRGIVAAALGRRYVGVELRAEQVEANRAQWPIVEPQLEPDRPPPVWHVGDSLAVLPQLDVEADLIFSCPPYGDLEIYSDDPADISAMEAAEFDKAYRQIIAAAVAKLKPDRFACFVVGDFRDKRGLYRNFVSSTIEAFHAAGAHLYNEIILITTIGSLAIRTAKQFRAARKVGKSHQQVLIFVKGNPKKATKAMGPVDVSQAMALSAPDEG